MPSKAPLIIAGLATFVILFLLALFSVFAEVITLNGATESQGFNAVLISVICQALFFIPAILLARWLTKRLIERAGWNQALAILCAVVAASLLGGAVSFLSIIISIVAVGVR